MALSGDVAIVAAGSHADQPSQYTKVAYVFRRTSGVWVQEGVFEQAAPTGYDIESTSVGVSGHAAVVGLAVSNRCAPDDDSCSSMLENHGAFVLEAIDKRTPVPDARVWDDAIAPDSAEPDSSQSSSQYAIPAVVGGCEASGRRSYGSPAVALLSLPLCVWAWRRRRRPENGFSEGKTVAAGEQRRWFGNVLA